jgi:hypothetical protein
LCGRRFAGSDASRLASARRPLTLALERFPTEWNHSVDKKSLEFKELEHVLIEKVGELFRNMH